ncbi:uncharacterized protein LOC128861906 [Anastrepha ludens]|uniref:uncharacterized protein LOC128861906 n=1 Tax=Anastrepha ludens TaxID=28586 RepID=UPI0023B01B5D|nr:uncharacterized protein LOC128861906 [Anastrepha ludens]
MDVPHNDLRWSGGDEEERSWRMNILQINLQHSKAASANLLIHLEQDEADIVLIQEPWLSSNGISGLRTKSYKLVAYSRTGKPRSCILIRRELNAFILHNFSNEDIVTVSLEGPAGKLWLMSVYMAHDDEVESPPALLRETLAEAKRRKIGVIIGTDANSHHTCWGSSNINARDLEKRVQRNARNSFPCKQIKEYAQE